MYRWWPRLAAGGGLYTSLVPLYALSHRPMRACLFIRYEGSGKQFAKQQPSPRPRTSLTMYSKIGLTYMSGRLVCRCQSSLNVTQYLLLHTNEIVDRLFTILFTVLSHTFLLFLFYLFQTTRIRFSIKCLEVLCVTLIRHAYLAQPFDGVHHYTFFYTRAARMAGACHSPTADNYATPVLVLTTHHNSGLAW